MRGIDLTRIDVVKLTTEWTDGRETEGRALKLQYGEGHSAGPSARWLIVVEGTSRDELPRFDTGPPFASGQLRVMGFSTSSGDSVLWLGAVELDGVFITLESPNRDVVLAAARALKQMP